MPSGMAFLWGEFQWEGGLWEEKPSSSWLKMCTCELSLLHADPDVNRVPLMSKGVDKQAFIASFYLGLSSAKGFNSIIHLVENHYVVKGCFFLHLPFLLVCGFGCEPGDVAASRHNILHIIDIVYILYILWFQNAYVLLSIIFILHCERSMINLKPNCQTQHVISVLISFFFLHI